MADASAGKGRRASARRPAGSAPQTEDRLDRLEAMMKTMMQHLVADGSVGVEIVPAAAMASDEDDREDQVDRVAEKRAREQREAVEDAAARDAIAALIDPRHAEILQWLCGIQGKRPAQLLKEILRSALIRERPAWREAQGKGGNSSRDIGALERRLPRA